MPVNSQLQPPNASQLTTNMEMLRAQYQGVACSLCVQNGGRLPNVLDEQRVIEEEQQHPYVAHACLLLSYFYY